MTTIGGASIHLLDRAKQLRLCCCCAALGVLVACTGTGQDDREAVPPVTPAATVVSSKVVAPTTSPSTSPTTSAAQPNGCPGPGAPTTPAGLEAAPETAAPPDSQAPRQARITADYRFENSLANSVSAAVDLLAIGADATEFIDQEVLSHTQPVLKKIVDFNDAREDCGLYNLDGRMDFWPITSGFGAALARGGRTATTASCCSAPSSKR